ncbi:Vacuolar protein sorting-associated protein 62 [Paecilomyces lecythidis]|uniref:Vacuolar protein sorting-associated protein 62 n=1 Tax=Paecilomyces lecythidis TaxID=3004212 RepID=A0ABR3WTF3_9EURO
MLSLQLHHGGHAPLFPSSFAIHPSATGLSLQSCSPADNLGPSQAYQSIVIPPTTAPSQSHEQQELPGPDSDIDAQQAVYVHQQTSQTALSFGPNDLVESEDSRDLSLSQQMTRKSWAAIAVLSSLIAYVSVNSLYRAVNPSAFIWYEEDYDEPRWIASSHSWFDRKACRWLGLCGTAHFRLGRSRFGHRKAGVQEPLEGDQAPWRSSWGPAANLSVQWSDDDRVLREIPDYVLEYAPLVHLSSKEQFWPGDIAEHLYHTTPMLNYTPVQSSWEHPTLRDLDQLNQFQKGKHVFLTSNDNVEDRPAWLEGEKNIPDPGDSDPEEAWADWDGRVDSAIPGDTQEERAKWYDSGDEGLSRPDTAGPVAVDTPEGEELLDELRKRYGGKRIRNEGTNGGRSDAPAVLVVVDKGHGIVDAFWFYFYSFNLGNVVLNVRFGNHVGDWEHCLVRFHNGKPKALFFSAHAAGEAYSYEAVEKIGKRPVIYSAVGTHAMYATPGIHEYILPWGLLHDETDRGPLWDPVLNSHTYTYDYLNDTLRASVLNPNSPTEWFYFNGHWGDKFYPLGDQRQYRFAGQYHYVNGPLGPRFKNLNRRKVCQGSVHDPCVIRNWIGDSPRAKRWTTSGPGE